MREPLTQWEQSCFHAALSRLLRQEFPDSDTKPNTSTSDD